jgi:signal transduction histidine kinase
LDVTTRWSLETDLHGNPARVLTTDTDITARKQAEELMRSEARRLDALVQQRTARLQETIGELEAFSYSVSHDMRAPLRAMQGYARALLDDYKDRLDDEAAQYLDRICRAANRLDVLVQDVLAYSRVAKDEITLHPVDLEGLIQDILSTHPEFQEPRSRILVAGPLHPVLGHEAYLTQCLTNLLGNAVKFVPEDVVPEVRIRSERLDGRVRLWIEDNGIGIEPANHERIFQIFGQVYSEKKYGGTGIGLAIVRKAVQRMSGEVGLESEMDKGSRFWLSLREANDGN